MTEPSSDVRTDRWFEPLLRGLPAAVRYRLFRPAYEDLRQEDLLRLGRTRWLGVRLVLRAWFALRVVSLVVSCYRGTPEFVLVHPFRAGAAALGALVPRNPAMLSHDIHQALRLLWKRPVFSGTVILILALGIGASTSIFSIVDAVLLRPLPFHDADRLVAIDETFDGSPTAVSPVDAFDWQRDARSFRSIAIYMSQGVTLAWNDQALAVDGYAVSASFFPTLGLRPAVGRWFVSEDDRAGGPTSVVLSHGLWVRVFGADRGVIGRRVFFDSAPYTVIGVAPAGAEFPEKSDAWFSLALSPRSTAPTARGAHYVSAIARLQPGVSLEQANAEMRTIAARMAAAYPRTNEGYGARVADLLDEVVGSARRALLLILGAVGLLLLIACVNVSGLLMARAATRRTEMALRAALGAGRLALVRQVFVESLVLALAAACVGTVLAAWGTQAALAIVPDDLPRAGASNLNLQVLGFTLVVAIGAAVLFGVLPALQAMTSSLGGSLKDGRSDAGTGSGGRLRGALIAVEVALALVLLIGAGLTIRSFDLLTRVSPGFDPRGVLMFSVSLPDAVYKEGTQAAAFYRDLVAELDRLPGVVASGAVMIPPVSNSGFGGTFSIEGRPQGSGVEESRAQVRPIAPAYFHALGVSVVRGRAFTGRDGADAPRVAIISETAARSYWPGEDPIGKRLRLHVSAVEGKETFREIVGVVSDVKTYRLDVPARAVIYVPHAQHPVTSMTMLVRTAGDPAALAGSALAVLRRLDKSLVATGMETLEDHVATSRGAQRFRAVLLGLFAGTAFLLAIVGLYAVVAYSTGRRRHEIGVRVALGATARHIVRMVVADGMKPVLAGVALGCAAAYALSSVMTGLLFGVRPFEPAIVAGVALLLGAAAAAACYLPARRAATVDPREALRAE